jgi:amino acid transporter
MIAGHDEAGGLARGVVGSARTIAFGTSIVAPSASAATVLVLVVAYAGFASPLVVLITFAGSLCCALSIGQFAGRLPSAGWAYTYNSRGLGPAAGFLTGWMMIFAYALFVPAGVGLTSAFGSQLLASTHPVPWCLHAGEPAAFHFSRLAPDRCHCRGHPAGATARHLPGLGKSRRTELDKQLEPD